ncbi:MAG: hypothetical protein OXB92_03330 [Acidimicrobiaceae bacterium]|nr:hypothetical protein [Acidimicrobiaceae bacterium]
MLLNAALKLRVQQRRAMLVSDPPDSSAAVRADAVGRLRLSVL